MNKTKSLLEALIRLIENDCYLESAISEFKSLNFHVTRTDIGSIILQHLTFDLRGQVTFFKYSGHIGDIYLIPDESLYKAFKVDIKTFDEFQYSKLFGGAKNMNTQTSVIFVNNILEGRKIIIHRRR